MDPLLPSTYLPSTSNPMPMTSPADRRVGDLERSRACDHLSAQFATGRLTPDELDARLALAMQAQTVRDLYVVTRDLPPMNQSSTLPTSSTTPIPTGTPASQLNGWDVLAVLGLVAAVLVAGGLTVLAGAFEVWAFLGAFIGGSAAFVAGVTATYLTGRIVRRTTAR